MLSTEDLVLRRSSAAGREAAACGCLRPCARNATRRHGSSPSDVVLMGKLYRNDPEAFPKSDPARSDCECRAAVCADVAVTQRCRSM